MPIDVTVQCNKCNCSDLYTLDDVDSSVKTGASFDKCLECGEKEQNVIISLEGAD